VVTYRSCSAGYLHQAGHGEWEYVTGERVSDFYSHAWLEQDGLIVDITADQFEGIDQPVIVTHDRRWHRQFSNRGPRHPAPIDIYDPATRKRLREMYIRVAASVTGRQEHLSLFYENDDNPADGYFLNVEAPRPGQPHGSSSWSITISQWIVTRYDSDGEAMSAEGDTVLECIPPERPTAGELDSLLTLAESDPGQMSAWAKTPVGDALAGTAFIVTSRDNDR
jgi:hypothetical protein